jgi:hypothetical protein
MTTIRQKIPDSIKLPLWKSYLWGRSLSGSRRMMPDFIIIGTQKGGTTSLYHYLSQHPQIMPALEKELRFWDYKYHKGLNWYRAHFPLISQKQSIENHAQRPILTGEASPNYLFDPRPPQRIAQYLPHIKLIVLLRNPVDRAYSSYQMGIRRQWETLSFADAIAQEATRLSGELKKIRQDERFIGINRHNFAYLERGKYAQQLTSWLELFDRKQFLFLNSETFFSDPQTAWQQTLTFLGLNPFTLNKFKKHNSGGTYNNLDPKIRQQLTSYFTPYNQALTDLIGIDFQWEAAL